jgi:hypothetical protein
MTDHNETNPKSSPAVPAQVASPIPTLNETVERMKREILLDVQAGLVPASVKSFSHLHDFRDGNCYGGFCEDALADALITHFGGRDQHEGMPQAMLDYINAAQDAINEWIAADGIGAFEVQTGMVSGWENCWTLDDDIPERFVAAEAALAELKEHLEDTRTAVAEGHITDADTVEGFRVVDRVGRIAYAVIENEDGALRLGDSVPLTDSASELPSDLEKVRGALDEFLTNEHDKHADEGLAAEIVESLLAEIKEDGEKALVGLPPLKQALLDYVMEVFGATEED